MVPRPFIWSRACSSASFLDSYSSVVYRKVLYGGRKSRWYQCSVEDFKSVVANSVRRRDLDYIVISLEDATWIHYRDLYYRMVVE